MNSLTGSILIDFQSMPGSQQQKNYHKQVYGAIKLQLSQMQKYQRTSSFVTCQNCGMILTKQDRDCVYDWQEISSNKKQFQDVIEVCEKQQQNVVVWICSFCQKKNIVQCDQLKFAKNNSRVVVKQAVANSQKKDPILLIVFDISGSMDQVLPNQQHTFTGLIQRIKKTKIYQKIVSDQQAEIKQILERQKIKLEGNDSKYKYRDYLKKNKLLMGLTQWLIGQINPNNTNGNEKMSRQGGFGKGSSVKKTKVDKTVGFMFFNSNVILDPRNGNPDKQAVVVCDTRQGYGSKTQNMIRERVNFDDFQSLYRMGATYGSEFNTKINDIQFNSLQYKFGDCTHGQTALGPAIMMALGVISQHGAGSSIVVVTDGIGNRGIFDQSQKWQEQFRMLKMRLQKHKCFMTMLECRNISENPNTKDMKLTCIDQFCQRNQDTIARKINILVDKNKTAEHLIQDVRKKMVASINRDNVIWTNKVLIKSKNSNVTFQQDMTRLSQKLHNQQQPTYINPKINYSKLTQKDYMHHFMTQAVIHYENTQSGEQSIFLTYILKKFIKFTSIKKQVMKKLDTQQTFLEMMEYLSNQQQTYNINNLQLSWVKKSFRDTLMFSRSICNRSMRYSSLSRGQRREQDDLFMEQIFRKNQNYQKQIKQEQNQDDSVSL